MKEKIWEPLDIKDMTFWPKQNPDMQDRMAGISTLSEKGEGPAVDAPDFDSTFAATDCLGGAGGYGSIEAYFAFLQAVLRRDPKLLSDESWTELFRPQLNEQCKKELNEILKATPMHTQYMGMSLPTSIVKQWSFAGLICESGQEGRMNDGTIFWGGVPSMIWVMQLQFHATTKANDLRIVSRLQSWHMWDSVLPSLAADEPEHSGASRAVPEGGFREGIRFVKCSMSHIEET
jgi:CubicO group peptidase (beta-lactamase class C family)